MESGPGPAPAPGPSPAPTPSANVYSLGQIYENNELNNYVYYISGDNRLDTWDSNISDKYIDTSRTPKNFDIIFPLSNIKVLEKQGGTGKSLLDKSFDGIYPNNLYINYTDPNTNLRYKIYLDNKHNTDNLKKLNMELSNIKILESENIKYKIYVCIHIKNSKLNYKFISQLSTFFNWYTINSTDSNKTYIDENGDLNILLNGKIYRTDDDVSIKIDKFNYNYANFNTTLIKPKTNSGIQKQTNLLGGSSGTNPGSIKFMTWNIYYKIYKDNDKDNALIDIKKYIKNINPDILFIQESNLNLESDYSIYNIYENPKARSSVSIYCSNNFEQIGSAFIASVEYNPKKKKFINGALKIIGKDEKDNNPNYKRPILAIRVRNKKTNMNYVLINVWGPHYKNSYKEKWAQQESLFNNHIKGILNKLYQKNDIVIMSGDFNEYYKRRMKGSPQIKLTLSDNTDVTLYINNNNTDNTCCGDTSSSTASPPYIKNIAGLYDRFDLFFSTYQISITDTKIGNNYQSDHIPLIVTFEENIDASLPNQTIPFDGGLGEHIKIIDYISGTDTFKYILTDGYGNISLNMPEENYIDDMDCKKIKLEANIDRFFRAPHNYGNEPTPYLRQALEYKAIKITFNRKNTKFNKAYVYTSSDEWVSGFGRLQLYMYKTSNNRWVITREFNRLLPKGARRENIWAAQGTGLNKDDDDTNYDNPTNVKIWSPLRRNAPPLIVIKLSCQLDWEEYLKGKFFSMSKIEGGSKKAMEFRKKIVPILKKIKESIVSESGDNINKYIMDYSNNNKEFDKLSNIYKFINMIRFIKRIE